MGLIKTVKTGRASSPTTWLGGKIPSSSDSIIVSNKHTLTLDIDLSISGCLIESGGTLNFDAKKSVVLTTTKNVIVEGRFRMSPQNITVKHDLLFININENNFSGETSNVLENDIGLWVLNNGKLEIIGTKKTSWVRLKKAAKAGDTVIYLDRVPTGWTKCLLALAPTKKIDKSGFYNDFDLITINLSGATDIIYLDKPLQFDHPMMVNEKTGEEYGPELINLTRNVRISGTGDGTANPLTNGRSHIHIKSTQKHILSYFRLRNMGPRKASSKYTDFIPNRCALNFDHCNLAMSGSTIEGVVSMDSGNTSFLTNGTHGITYLDCVTYNTFENQWRWDRPPNNGNDPVHNSNNITYDNCIAALTKSDPPNIGVSLTDFEFGAGVGNKCINCVGIANQGGARSANFGWPEWANYLPNLWTFKNNLSHNNKTNGIMVWQNDPNKHLIERYSCFNCGEVGIEHGAYTNGYDYVKCYLYGNKVGIRLHANARPKIPLDVFGYRSSFIEIFSSDILHIVRHTLQNGGPTLFKDCNFSKITVDELPRRIPFAAGNFDFVDSNKSNDFNIIGIEEASRIRIQNKDECVEITNLGINKINNFFPLI